jgi:hypothetical protein
MCEEVKKRERVKSREMKAEKERRVVRIGRGSREKNRRE